MEKISHNMKLMYYVAVIAGLTKPRNSLLPPVTFVWFDSLHVALTTCMYVDLAPALKT